MRTKSWRCPVRRSNSDRGEEGRKEVVTLATSAPCFGEQLRHKKSAVIMRVRRGCREGERQTNPGERTGER